MTRKPKNGTQLPNPEVVRELSAADVKKLCFSNDFNIHFVDSLLLLVSDSINVEELLLDQKLYSNFFNDFKKLFTSRVSRGKIYRSYYKPILTKFGEQKLKDCDITIEELANWYKSYKKSYTSTNTVSIIFDHYNKNLATIFEEQIITRDSDDKELHKKCVHLGYTAGYQNMRKENELLPPDIESLTYDKALDFCSAAKDGYTIVNSRTIILKARGSSYASGIEQLRKQRETNLTTLKTISKDTNIRMNIIRDIDKYLGGINKVHNMSIDELVDKLKKFTYGRKITDVVCFVLNDAEKSDTLQRKLPHTHFKMRKVDLYFANRINTELHKIAQSLLAEYEIELQSSSSFSDDRIRDKELRIVALFEFMDKYIPENIEISDLQQSEDIIVSFIMTCTYQQVYDLILAYGHVQNHDNTRTKSKAGTHHHATSGVQTAIWFIKKLKTLCPCSKEIAALSNATFLSQIENKSELLDWDQRRTYERDEIDSMLKVCIEEDNVKDQLLITILREVALRNSAICNLNLSNIVNDNMTIPKHTCRVKEKGNKTREFITSPNMKTIILRYLHEYRDVIGLDKYVFSRNQNLETKMGSSTLNNVLKRIGARAGVTDVNIQAHTFRHTLVGELMDAGNKVESVSKFIGHTSVDTTINYYWLKNMAELYSEMKHPCNNPIITAEEISAEEEEEVDMLNTKIDASLQVVGFLMNLIKNGDSLETIQRDFYDHNMEISKVLKHIAYDSEETMSTMSTNSYRNFFYNGN
jgi:integrase